MRFSPGQLTMTEHAAEEERRGEESHGDVKPPTRFFRSSRLRPSSAGAPATVHSLWASSPLRQETEVFCPEREDRQRSSGRVAGGAALLGLSLLLLKNRVGGLIVTVNSLRRVSLPLLHVLS